MMTAEKVLRGQQNGTYKLGSILEEDRGQR